jgi:hypothetical protein
MLGKAHHGRAIRRAIEWCERAVGASAVGKAYTPLCGSHISGGPEAPARWLCCRAAGRAGDYRDVAASRTVESQMGAVLKRLTWSYFLSRSTAGGRAVVVFWERNYFAEALPALQEVLERFMLRCLDNIVSLRWGSRNASVL